MHRDKRCSLAEIDVATSSYGRKSMENHRVGYHRNCARFALIKLMVADERKEENDRVSTDRSSIEPACSEFRHAMPADVPGKHENNGSVTSLNRIFYSIARITSITHLTTSYEQLKCQGRNLLCDFLRRRSTLHGIPWILSRHGSWTVIEDDETRRTARVRRRRERRGIDQISTEARGSRKILRPSGKRERRNVIANSSQLAAQQTRLRDQKGPARKSSSLGIYLIQSLIYRSRWPHGGGDTALPEIGSSRRSQDGQL